jgi:agmatine deiminase
MKNPTHRALSGHWPALLGVLALAAGSEAQTVRGIMPDQAAPHEGTWLQWPHHHTYGVTYRNRLDATWVAMTSALVQSERVHVIAYDAAERSRIQGLLAAAGVPLAGIDFLLRANDDCWVRDNGPIFVYSPLGRLKVTDWGFNGWGLDTPFALDDTVPLAVATRVGVPRVDLGSTVLEGGAIEVDGNGVLMATRSSILEPDRNPGLSQAQLEDILRTNLGVTKFIWLDGAPGGQLDITDMHIDGFAMFGPAGTIVTMSSASLTYWGLSSADISRLFAASDVNNVPYSFVTLPLTAANVVTAYGFNVGFKGSYVNYYVANTVVLVPAYNDVNDVPARNILQQLYPDRTAISIDVRNLYRDGGMVHCVTQQQPLHVRHVRHVRLR